MTPVKTPEQPVTLAPNSDGTTPVPAQCPAQDEVFDRRKPVLSLPATGPRAGRWRV